MQPRHLRFGMNLWPPFLGAGIRVRHVWDQAASIEFVAPGRGTVSAVFRLTEAEVEAIRAQAASGEKVLPAFDVEVRGADNALVARVRKTLYVRLKPRFRPTG